MRQKRSQPGQNGLLPVPAPCDRWKQFRAIQYSDGILVQIGVVLMDHGLNEADSVMIDERAHAARQDGYTVDAAVLFRRLLSPGGSDAASGGNDDDGVGHDGLSSLDQHKSCSI